MEWIPTQELVNICREFYESDQPHLLICGFDANARITYKSKRNID